MAHVFKRLVLGLFLIVAAASVLLISDWQRRVPTVAELPRVAVFQFATRPLMDECVQGVIDGLAENGFKDGTTVRLQRFNAENDLPTANSISRAIVDQGFAMVVTSSTPCMQIMASANKQGKLRHVFCAVTDPFGAGAGISRDDPLKHPPHLAGIGTFQPVEAAFRIARQLNPKLKKVGSVWNPGEACSEACTVKARKICSELGIELMEAQVDSSSGVLEAAESVAARGVEAIWIGGDNTVEMAQDSVIKAAKKVGIPVFSHSPGAIERGLLFALGANYHEVGRTAGHMAARILRGVDPATIRIEDVMPRRLALNLATLKGMKPGWVIPPDVLASVADLVDEQGVLRTQPPSTQPGTTPAPVSAVVPPTTNRP